jgi:O-antigen ligase
MKKNLNIFYFSLVFVLNWDIIWLFFLNKSSGVFTGIILMVFTIFMLNPIFKTKGAFKLFFKKPISIWFLWVIYSLINMFNSELSTSENLNISFLGFVIMPLLLMVVISNVEGHKIKELVNVLIFALVLKILIAMIFDSFGDEFGGNRFGAEFNANMLGFSGVIILVLLLVVKSLIKKLSLFHLLAGILAIFIIYITASRKSFLALVLIAFGYIYIFSENQKSIKYLRMFIGGLFVAFIGFFIFNESEVVRRLTNTLIETSQATSELEMFDGRMIQYAEGVEVFNDNKLTGVGLLNYKYLDEWGLVLHSEYLVQLIECGIIGSILYLYFNFYIILKLFKLRKFKNFRQLANVFLLYFVILTFLSFGSWTYNLMIWWIITGLSIRFINNSKYFN